MKDIEHRDDYIFRGKVFFDIFDEVDALLNPRKEHVFSIGKPD